MIRLEFYELYDNEGEYSREWWDKFMPEGSKYPGGKDKYRRTHILFKEIERPIEIKGNKKQCILRLWSGEELVVKYNYDDLCIKLCDIENEMEDLP